MAVPNATIRLVATITTAASNALGRELPIGTTVVASPDREGSRVVVAYPLGDRTIIWCAPELGPALTSLNGRVPLNGEDFLRHAEELGGVALGTGNHRVLSVPAPDPAIERTRLISLDRDDADHRALIDAFVGACSDDDCHEAALDMDDLHEAIVGVLDGSGAIAAYSSARPWYFDADVDDVAVITHPDHRRQGLATAAVAALSQRRQRSGRVMFYGCNVGNDGSNRVAEAVGFELLATVAAAQFA